MAIKWIGAGNMRVMCIYSQCCCQGKVSIMVELMMGREFGRGRGRIWMGRRLVGEEDFGWLLVYFC